MPGSGIVLKAMDMPQKSNVPKEQFDAQFSRFRSLSDPETLARIAQNLEEGIYITTETGEILDANPAFLRIFGITELRELKNYRVNDFVDAEVRSREVALIEREGSLRNRELQITRLDGEVRTVLDSWYMIRDADSGEKVFHGILVDITARKNLETQLVEQSIRDPLTGCYNRRHLANIYGKEYDNNDAWGCIYVDIDHFKQYNDVHGHAAGDTVLMKMSRFLMRHVRAEEAVVRMGGDEFLVLLADTTVEEARTISRRIETVGLKDAPVSFSLGWAARENNETFEETVNRADRELIAVRVISRPGRYTRRTPPEANKNSA